MIARIGGQRMSRTLGQEIPPREQQTSEWLGAYNKAESVKWWLIIKVANIEVE
jgi:hypothetical protein